MAQVNFSTTSQEAHANGVKCLVYGPSGMGKTMLSITAPAPIIISAEAGLLSLAPVNIQRVHGVDNPSVVYDATVIKVSNVDELSAAFDFCSGPQANMFQTICIDSISEILEVVLANAKRQVKDPRQAYGELMDKGMDLIRKFRDIPGKNVVVFAKQEPMKDELTGVIKFGPSSPGTKVGPAIPYFFDEVFRIGVNKDQQGNSYRFLQTQPDLQYEAKDRSGALATIEYPHLGAIFAKIQGQ